MNKILSQEEVGYLTVFDGLTHIETPLLAEYIRYIEQTILKKLNSAEPVAYIHHIANGVSLSWYAESSNNLSDKIEPLFTHPAPSVPEGLHIIDCGFKRCGTEATPTILIGFAENDWDARDKFKAMLAAARSE